jgi:hypothetical protein
MSALFYNHIPLIWPDEVLFFNPSLELSRTGIMKTSVLSGLIPGMEAQTLWMPPVFMILLSSVFKIFPAELFTARMFSSFIALYGILIAIQFCKNLQFSKRKIFVIVLLIVTDIVFLKFSHTSRMESLCFFFGILSIYFLSIDLKEKIQTKHFIISSIALSLSFLSHPFGLIYFFPMMIFWFYREKPTPRNLFIYFVGGIIPISIWALYILPNFTNFLIQFGAQLSRKNELLEKFSYIEKVKIIFSGFSFPILKVFLLGVTFIILFFTKIYKEKYFLFFLLWTMIVFIFLLLSSESWYVFHLILPMTVIISFLYESKNKWVKYFLYLNIFYNCIFALYLPFQFYLIHKSHLKIEDFFNRIALIVEHKEKIYLQCLPDPYFYLTKKFPEKQIIEFIPGELSPTEGKINFRENADLPFWKRSYKLNPEFYASKVYEQDIFIFYNENLMNPVIKKYLSENPDLYERKKLIIDTSSSSGLKLEAVIFIRR